MLLRGISIVVILFISTSTCLATKIAPASLDELLKNSDYVAFVRINEEEILTTTDRLCGRKYQSQVLDGIKGVAAGELLEWNTLDGFINDKLEAGSLYVVFLTNPDRSYNPIYSTNSFSEQKRAMFEEHCGTFLQCNRVAHSGHGTLLIEAISTRRSKNKKESQVRVPIAALRMPSTLKVKPILLDNGRVNQLYGWVRLRDLLAYLHKQ
ncbi:MAG: hypothetical protein AB9866_06765 [Syntrophobacteraceae bacterium]